MAHSRPDRNPKAASLEMLAVVIVVASFLWFGRQLFPGVVVIFAAALLSITGWSHRRAGDTVRDVGLRWDTAPAAVAWLLPVVIAVAATALAIGEHLGSLRAPTVTQAFRSLAQFTVSGFLQQYLLLGFFYRRAIEAVRSVVGAATVTATVFAALHVPNGFLVGVTFGAGFLSCAVYRRAPNLYVAGIAHGALVYVLFVALPPDVTGNMRVGIEYFQQ